MKLPPKLSTVGIEIPLKTPTTVNVLIQRGEKAGQRCIVVSLDSALGETEVWVIEGDGPGERRAQVHLDQHLEDYEGLIDLLAAAKVISEDFEHRYGNIASSITLSHNNK